MMTAELLGDIGSSKERLHEVHHFIFLYGSAAVGVESIEDFSEVIVVQLWSGGDSAVVICASGFVVAVHVVNCVVDELLRLIVLQRARVVFVVPSPYLVDHATDCLLFGGCHFPMIVQF